MKYVYPAIIQKEEDGGYSVVFPDLRGCATQGDSLYEALEMAEDVLNLWLCTMEEDGEPIPRERKYCEMRYLELIEPYHAGCVVTLVKADTDAYRKKYPPMEG